jgi:ribonuclease E
MAAAELTEPALKAPPMTEIAESVPAVAAREPHAAAPNADETAHAQPESDPNRPRRSGWWQRARASLVGE